MEKRINMGGEFYMADFGYFSMGVYNVNLSHLLRCKFC